MLINDPLGEGSNASSYRQRALESGGLLPRMRGNLDAQKGAAFSKVTLYGEGSKASSTNQG